MAEIIIADYSGFCFGVKRAVESAYKTIKNSDKKNVYVLGDIIHNPKVVNELSNLGVKKIKSLDEIAEPADSVLIIRSHGVSKKIIEKTNNLKLEVTDTTCPFVKKIEVIIDELFADNYAVVIVGDKQHPEVSSLNDSFDNKLFILETPNDIKDLLFAPNAKIGVVAQTTQSSANYKECISSLIGKCAELRVFNTICKSTAQRQNSSIELARKTDVMIVIGGKNSANTTRLYEICRNINSDTYHIEDKNELKKDWFDNKNKIGITAGASTPSAVIEEIINEINLMIN